MAEATSDGGPDDRPDLPTWTTALGWLGVAGLIYLLICAVSIISRGFAGLGSDAARTMFAFAASPRVGLERRRPRHIVLIQPSTATISAIAVTAVGRARAAHPGSDPHHPRRERRHAW
ncbi:hypothetical protein [Streptomyces sp. KL116D]|uniref:hypothetical protein n=1 Tax=Streptomyces sp. KL116D TaxID=3045152 RepID=UPI003555EE96